MDGAYVCSFANSLNKPNMATSQNLTWMVVNMATSQNWKNKTHVQFYNPPIYFFFSLVAKNAKHLT
jgi:hypothetical protein